MSHGLLGRRREPDRYLPLQVQEVRTRLSPFLLLLPHFSLLRRGVASDSYGLHCAKAAGRVPWITTSFLFPFMPELFSLAPAPPLTFHLLPFPLFPFPCSSPLLPSRCSSRSAAGSDRSSSSLQVQPGDPREPSSLVLLLLLAQLTPVAGTTAALPLQIGHRARGQPSKRRGVRRDEGRIWREEERCLECSGEGEGSAVVL